VDLWSAWSCPYCMRVRAALAEKGVPYRTREIDLGSKPPELLALNPKGGVPVLVDGERTIPDSFTILEYLDEQHPEPRLFPDGPGREAVKEAYDRVNGLLGPHLFKLARGTPEEKSRAAGAVGAALAGLDPRVHASGHLLSQFSAADLALASFVGKLPPELRPSALGLPGLARWERLVMDRPAVRDQMAARAAG
jgi:glutathione S-transferase